MLALLTLALSVSVAAVPSIDEPLKTGQRAPGDTAVVIGIERYFVLPDVPYARRDAEAFYRFLVYTRGVPSARVQLLDDGASRETIFDAVDRAAAESGADGTVWVYYAGHGAAAPSSGARLLLGDDVRADLASFEARAVPVAELGERASSGAGRAFLVLDTCYTGSDRSGAALIAGKRFAVPSYVTLAPRVGEWAAAGPGEWSGPLEEARHGAFTYFAIGAMRGWADGQLTGERDGQVTAEEAQLYVADALRALQVEDQSPALVLESPETWVLSSGADEEPPLLDATASPGETELAAEPVETSPPVPDQNVPPAPEPVAPKVTPAVGPMPEALTEAAVREAEGCIGRSGVADYLAAPADDSQNKLILESIAACKLLAQPELKGPGGRCTTMGGSGSGIAKTCWLGDTATVVGYASLEPYSPCPSEGDWSESRVRELWEEHGKKHIDDFRVASEEIPDAPNLTAVRVTYQLRSKYYTGGEWEPRETLHICKGEARRRYGCPFNPKMCIDGAILLDRVLDYHLEAAGYR